MRVEYLYYLNSVPEPLNLQLALEDSGSSGGTVEAARDGVKVVASAQQDELEWVDVSLLAG